MNRSGIRTTEYEAKRDILFTTNPVVAVGVRVNANGITDTDDKGRKVILAGSALGGSTNPLMERQTELSYAPSGTNVHGVTQHNIYFWPEDDFAVANANLIIFGFVDINKMEEAARPSTGVIEALENRVTFVNGI